MAAIAVPYAYIGRKGHMGRKNVGDRPCFSDCRRFAELVNIVLYDGECIVLPENLRLRQRKYPSLGSGQ